MIVYLFVCSYRLAPKVTFPVPFEDCLKATQYFFSHSDMFGIDTKRLAVAGTSITVQPSRISLKFISVA